jgi:hypothetical protein
MTEPQIGSTTFLRRPSSLNMLRTPSSYVENSHEEIRAASSVLLFLGHVYIWPDPDHHLRLAADQLEEVSRLDSIAESPELVEEICAGIQELRSRIKTSGTSQLPPPAAKNWWQWTT